MKLAFVAVAALAGIASANPSLQEYAPRETIRDAHQLTTRACELDIELRGAIAVAELRDRIVNPGPNQLAASYELDVPRGAVVTGVTVRGETGMIVPTTFRTEPMEAEEVLGADPALVTALPDGRFRIVLQPFSGELAVAIRWAMTADIHDGALHLVVPGRGALPSCRGTVRAIPGPGSSIAKIRPPSFTLAAAAQPIAVDLEFAGKEPVVWQQRDDLGDGVAASIVTVVAPPVRSTALPAHRALFVIDGSRSMTLVGTANVARVVQAIGAALPANTELDAIVYDRTPSRVFGEWRPSTPSNVHTIETAISTHVAKNGSDLAAAFELAHTALADGARGSAMVIVITDGVFGEMPDTALAQALAAKTSAVDVHAIVLDPAKTRTPGAAPLRSPVNLYGGTFVEVSVGELDDALGSVGAWLRPSWLELAMPGVEVPLELRTGAGVTRVAIGHTDFTLTGHGDAPIRIAARPGPNAPIAALALAKTTELAFANGSDPSEAELERARRARTRALANHGSIDAEHALAVLSGVGRVAKSRKAMIKGGGPYTRIVELADPAFPTEPVDPASSPPTASAIDRNTLERLFRDQLQRQAYVCYQRALAATPALAGTVFFDLELGRGEVTSVKVTGLNNAAFDACLVDAAYKLTPPLPDFDVNADDRTVAHYPLSFRTRDDHPVIIAGDADSSSPIDIEAVQGGLPVKRTPLKVDTKTPLGGLKPHP